MFKNMITTYVRRKKISDYASNLSLLIVAYLVLSQFLERRLEIWQIIVACFVAIALFVFSN